MKTMMIAAFLSFSSFVSADMEYPDIKKAGKLFTVTLTPGAKEASVHVVGNKTLDLQWDKTGLQAYLILGKTVRPLKVTKTKDTFVINEEVPKPSELKLELSHQDKKEEINIPIR
jgi:hypothetical protein